jgi:hypothetical protein
MATVIKIKKSETASSAPSTSDLVAGEIALNTADKKLFVRDSNDSIITVANFTESDQSLVFPTGDYGSVASALSTDAFGELLDQIYDLNTAIKYRLATEDLGAFS